MLSALALYRGMVLRGYEIDSFQLGFNALQALILAKVILLGDMMHLGDGARSEARLVPLLKKSLLYTLLEAAFKSLEDLTKRLFHGSGLGAAFQELFAKPYGETLAQLIVLFLALMPLFAVRDIDRAMGGNALRELFFGKRAAK